MSVHALPPPELVYEPRDVHYVTGAQLGKGGFAICHRAELVEKKKRTGKIVALKIVKSSMEPAKLAAKFVTELQLHSKLAHPNIVEFYRAFTYEASTYVVLEICDCGSLADALKKRKAFTMPEIRRFVIQTCGAVKYLHSRNIVHRDLKTGNLFLDKDMNVKVGDFGLAAVLMTKNDIGARRTTMCGTPNYLAPEIIEKGGRGHNEKVDLWAIGIIAYTLAVGKAPFHASKREDIYKKLQSCDYKWPELSKTNNDISNDLRELVSSLLVHEDDRPSPDQIVSHAFFKTAFVPVQMSEECTNTAPNWPQVRPPSPQTLQRGYSEGWYILCKASGVGEYAPGKIFPVVGVKKIRSIVRDCQKEIAAGLNPIVPIPADRVYLPFPARPNGLFPSAASAGHLSEIAEEKEPSSVEGRHLVETTANDRTRKAPERAVPSDRKASSSKENKDPKSNGVITIDSEPEQESEPKPKSLARTLSKRAAKPMSTLRAATEKIQRAGSVRGTSSTKGKEVERPMKTVQRKDSGYETAGNRTASAGSATGTVRRQEAPSRSAPAQLESPKPEDAPIPPTDPVAVLDRVAKFRDNVARALSSKDKAPRRTSKTQELPFVTKWVDYSKKHGVGYVLEDGKIGCVFKATSKYPVMHVVCQDGFLNLEKVAKDPNQMDKIPLQFYADRGADGLCLVDPEKDRKRTTAILWLKFARYMCQQLGQPESVVGAHSPQAASTAFVRLYQRIGTVGIWGFSDGCFQFNFPDHTKLVMSSDGLSCDFTCLSLDAAAHLAEHGEVPFKYIRQRQILSRPISDLLNGTAGQDSHVHDVAEANRLREKLTFIIDAMDEWCVGGGLGCFPGKAPAASWDGGRTGDYITVGRYGGDDVCSK